ncbi:MAG: capsular biosynthesis protein [Chloroflexi bacterium]|nr:capsular biosynthesis protein [Chloroflexota bacterium]|tara:strand:- start:2258 stop:3376 length:1119 start_codon:yes stop_codon:yes gene_type:complete
MGEASKILVTGARGFVGKNLTLRLKEQEPYSPIEFLRGDSLEKLADDVSKADAVVHLAGVNRPNDEEEFTQVNGDLTVSLCKIIKDLGRPVPLLLASSAQAVSDNPYGQSKRVAERAVQRLSEETGNPSVIYRLPGIFGKWCRPNYNSVVATFCHNIARGIPINITDNNKKVRLVYVDDVIDEFIITLGCMKNGSFTREVNPEYMIRLGDLAARIQDFRNGRTSLCVERVGRGLARALYATFLSYIPKEEFVYNLKCHDDERGSFVEMLKTQDSGQFSYFTAYPGVTRGGHYHHTKTEKFLVIKGNARFGFCNVLTGEKYQISVCGDTPQVVEPPPGWVHDITNIGDEEMVVLLWANEQFNCDRPDTVANIV